MLSELQEITVFACTSNVCVNNDKSCKEHTAAGRLVVTVYLSPFPILYRLKILTHVVMYISVFCITFPTVLRVHHLSLTTHWKIITTRQGALCLMVLHTLEIRLPKQSKTETICCLFTPHLTPTNKCNLNDKF